jgi:hypothetical protein
MTKRRFQAEEYAAEHRKEPQAAAEKRVRLCVDVLYDPQKTNPEEICDALDTLLSIATSTPGILDEYGDPEISNFEPLQEDK